MRSSWVQRFPRCSALLYPANVLFAEEGSGIRLIFTVPFDHHRMLWGPFNESGVLGLARSFVFVAAVGLLLGRAAWQRFRYRVQPFHLRRLAGRGAAAGRKR